MKNNKRLNSDFEKLKQAKNAANQAHFDLRSQQELSVQLLVDNSLEQTRFRPHPFLENTYYAHTQTIRAVRKDLFAAGSEIFEDLQSLIECHSCKEQLDLQFWNFCPHCGSQFKLESKKFC